MQSMGSFYEKTPGSELVDTVLDVLFGVAVIFLHFAFNLVGFAFALKAFVATQFARSFLDFALALLCSAFDLIFVHNDPLMGV